MQEYYIVKCYRDEASYSIEFDQIFDNETLAYKKILERLYDDFGDNPLDFRELCINGEYSLEINEDAIKENTDMLSDFLWSHGDGTGTYLGYSVEPIYYYKTEDK